MSDVKWTRHTDGSWSAHGYVIKRDRPSLPWRIIRDGVHWDSSSSLVDAKALVVRNYNDRAKKGQ